MSERQSRPSSSYLEPPGKSVELEDPGVQDSIASNSDEDHFSDASEGHRHSHSGRTSPIPRTRVEKVDEDPAHGDLPGTAAYEKRGQDAVPDQIEVIPEGSHSRSHSAAGSHDRPQTPGGTSVPRTVVEKVDPDQPAYGDIPGTPAYDQRKADSVPDVVTTAPEPGSKSPSYSPEPSDPIAADTQVPETLLSRVDTLPDGEGTPPHPHAQQSRASDPSPDSTERAADATDSPASLPTSPGNQSPEATLYGAHDEEKHVDDEDNENATNFGASQHLDQDQDQAPVDDFDDFAEEQDDMADDDFGDFDDGFQEGAIADHETMDQGDVIPPLPPTSAPPLVDFEVFQSLSDLSVALDGTLDNLFPASTDLSSLPPVEPIPNSSAIFNTERSLSLWSQLVAPPPLQPQNWVKSRIRRLFLVSLGVPVDLDEILPASKQKKLVLPSINLDGSGTTGPGSLRRSQSQARKDGRQGGPESPVTPGAQARSKTSRRREPSPAPNLDLSSVHRLCATTDAALDGFTEPELKGHVNELEHVTHRASNVLEYWLKQRDGLVGEKEAFEGVIENLVSHARRVRK